jgi:hypothetical protein
MHAGGELAFDGGGTGWTLLNFGVNMFDGFLENNINPGTPFDL